MAMNWGVIFGARFLKENFIFFKLYFLWKQQLKINSWYSKNGEGKKWFSSTEFLFGYNNLTMQKIMWKLDVMKRGHTWMEA